MWQKQQCCCFWSKGRQLQVFQHRITKMWQHWVIFYLHFPYSLSFICICESIKSNQRVGRNKEESFFNTEAASFGYITNALRQRTTTLKWQWGTEGIKENIDFTTLFVELRLDSSNITTAKAWLKHCTEAEFLFRRKISRHRHNAMYLTCYSFLWRRWIENFSSIQWRHVSESARNVFLQTFFTTHKQPLNISKLYYR